MGQGGSLPSELESCVLPQPVCPFRGAMDKTIASGTDVKFRSTSDFPESSVGLPGGTPVRRR